jgi:Ima1 N-terminal domain
MSRLLGLRRKPRCFYCQHVLDTAPADPYNFECPSCASRNHVDPKTGEIASSEPAMYDTMANSQSFSRRGESSAVWKEMTRGSTNTATPSKNAIRDNVEQSVFCRECTINQTLVTNMLANYLPLPSVSPIQCMPEAWTLIIGSRIQTTKHYWKHYQITKPL